MDKFGTILIVDDNKNILTALRILLGACFNRVITLTSPNNLLSTLQKESVDIILLDMNFSNGINNGNEGLFWLSEIKRQHSNIPVVLITAYADIALAVRGIKNGAADFVVKPWNNNELIATLTSVCGQKRIRQKSEKMDNSLNKEFMFWGETATMNALKELINKVAVTDVNILITGENGTGKEMLAKEIHRLSRRKENPMVSIDMGAVSETLFESELFGHAKGAFTDARNERIGKIEAASDGTLFLDEIGNLPYSLQPKLLTALQKREIVRVGSNLPIPVDIRLICATNKDLNKMVALQQFREDLLYRINTIHVEIPPLRERKEDLKPLADLFLNKYTTQYKKNIQGISKKGYEKLMEHPWYGNIRELEHIIEKAVILNDGEELTEKDFILTHGNNLGQEQIFSTLKDMEQTMIKNALNKYNGNLSLVATHLGITRQTLYNKIKKYGI